MSKCDICNNKIKEGLLNKIKGKYFWKNKKLQKMCSNCQKAQKNEKKVK